MSDDPGRTGEFQRNQSLEDILGNINCLLATSEKDAVENALSTNRDHPVVFVMGPLRSGTTLFTQWLASTGVVAYPTNLLARFYRAPVIGALIQLMLTDQRYNFRDELSDLQASPEFVSRNGKTQGSLSPNEFWYFWREALPFDEHYRLLLDQLETESGREFARTLRALTHVFDRPFALKGMICNYHIPLLSSWLDRAVFVTLDRDPADNVLSVLQARQRQFGNIEQWYSFRVPEYEQLRLLAPLEQAAGQVSSIRRAVGQGFEALDADRHMTVKYENFCADPARTYMQLAELLDTDLGRYAGTASFEMTTYRQEERDSAAAALRGFGV